MHELGVGYGVVKISLTILLYCTLIGVLQNNPLAPSYVYARVSKTSQTWG